MNCSRLCTNRRYIPLPKNIIRVAQSPGEALHVKPTVIIHAIDYYYYLLLLLLLLVIIIMK